MPVRVRGESVVLWEVTFQDENGDVYDHNQVADRAKEFVQDMIDLGGFGQVDATIMSQSDRVMTVRGISP